MKLYPEPNTTPTAGAVDQNNYYVQNPNTDTFHSFFARSDYQLSPMQRLFFTWRHNHRQQQVNNIFHNAALGDQMNRIDEDGTIGDTYTFSPTLIGELRLNYTRYLQNQDTSSAGYDSTALDFPSNMNSASGSPRLPDIHFANYQGVGYNVTSGTLGYAPFNSYGILGDVIKLRGTHSLKAGVDLRRFQKGNNYPAVCPDINSTNVICSNSYFYFDPTWTKATNTTSTAV